MMNHAPADTVAARCDAHVARRSLLEHPFYLAWREGTLPVPALRDYARDYGAFIGVVADGWAVAGQSRIAAIEQGHARVWERTFATALDTRVQSEPATPAAASLVGVARELFRDRADALGALYAFESQQPFTAQSKLAGLREHYGQLPPESAEYFKLHVDDFDEPALLAAEMDKLPKADQARAEAACERMSGALYEALSGIHAPHVG